MKKNIALMITVGMMLAMSGCSDKNNNSSVNTGTDNAQTASQVVASKEVDMDRVAGKELADALEDDSDEVYISGYAIEIDDAKVIDYNEEKIVVISFDFENKTSSEIAFDGAMTADVVQNGIKLRGAVITDVQGVNTNSAFETVKSGRDITVQKAYVLEDEASPVEVSVYKYGESGGNTAVKIFNLQ